MPKCICGYDFTKAHLKGRPLVSYALIPDKGYRAAIRREHAIVVESNPERKHRLIANAALLVGSLTRCPRCSAWLLAEPFKRGQSEFAVLRRVAPRANKSVPRVKS